MSAAPSPSSAPEENHSGEVPAIEVENLWKKYGFRLALRGVSLRVSKGDCLAVFGANGAGKSTLLKILSSRTLPTSGKAMVFGKDLVKHKLEARTQMGVVFHESALRADLSLNENLKFYSSLYGLGGMSEATRQLIETLGLQDRSNEPVRNFSRGMIQRATLIRSLLHDPQLWLLDEPFTGLDPKGRELIAQVIRSQREQGRTIIFITHDLDLGLELSSSAIALKDGELAAQESESIRELLLEASSTEGGSKRA